MYYLHPYKALASSSTCARYIRDLLSKLLGGGPVVYGQGGEAVLALSGFHAEDWPAVNLLAFLIYLWKKGVVEIPPTAVAPVVNEGAFHGVPVGREGANPYFDFLELKSAATRVVTQFYHKSRPRVVAVFLGGKEYEVAATTEVAAQTLPARKITPSPHTPEGAFTLKYSHGLVFRIPPEPREFVFLARHVADVLKRATALPPVERALVKVEKKEIYLLHGGREVEDGVLIDNDVYIYVR